MDIGRPQLHRTHPRFQGSHGPRPLHRPLGLPALGRSDGRGRGQVRQDLQSQAHARQNAPSLSPLLQPPPAAQPGRGHDSHQERPRHQAVHMPQAGQMGHQELPAVRGQDGLHSRRRNLHGPVQGPPLAPPRFSRQCCPPSHGELAGHQQEPHAVHGPLLQLSRALPHAEERAGSPGRGHRHAKPQALPRGTRQEADRACGGLHQVSLPPVSFHTVLHECSASGYSNFASRFRYMGAVDKNDQIAHLNKTRCHYRWPRRLFMKFLVWAAYNAYIIMDSYRPHSAARRRLPHSSPPRTFPGRHRQQPLRHLLRQVQQVPEETPGHRLRKHATQAQEDHVLVLHVPQVPLSACRQHMLE